MEQRNTIALYSAPEGVARLANTILSDTYPCYGTMTSRGYNLFYGRTTPCSITGVDTGNRYGLDPKVGPLQNNGGPTPTRALLSGSLGINAANPAAPGSGEPACPPKDQRMKPRGATRCDIGAFEIQ